MWAQASAVNGWSFTTAGGEQARDVLAAAVRLEQRFPGTPAASLILGFDRKTLAADLHRVGEAMYSEVLASFATREMSALLLDASTIFRHQYLVVSIANAGFAHPPAVVRVVCGFGGKAVDYGAVVRDSVEQLKSAGVNIGAVCCDHNAAQMTVLRPESLHYCLDEVVPDVLVAGCSIHLGQLAVGDTRKQSPEIEEMYTKLTAAADLLQKKELREALDEWDLPRCPRAFKSRWYNTIHICLFLIDNTDEIAARVLEALGAGIVAIEPPDMCAIVEARRDAPV
jgi:hypothetical protein